MVRRGRISSHRHDQPLGALGMLRTEKACSAERRDRVVARKHRVSRASCRTGWRCLLRQENRSSRPGADRVTRLRFRPSAIHPTAVCALKKEVPRIARRWMMRAAARPGKERDLRSDRDVELRQQAPQVAGPLRTRAGPPRFAASGSACSTRSVDSPDSRLPDGSHDDRVTELPGHQSRQPQQTDRIREALRPCTRLLVTLTYVPSVDSSSPPPQPR
jgi:hypothetical protein